MPIPIHVFVSSTMKELENERTMLRELIPTLGGGFVEITPWVFEHDEIARNRSSQQLCREKLADSALYLGLFWKRYGQYTIEDEHQYAQSLGIARHIYVKIVEDNSERDPQLQAFLDGITRFKTGVTAKWFQNIEVLKESVTEAMNHWLREWLTRPSGKMPRILQRDANGEHNIPPDLLPDPLVGRDSLLAGIQAALRKDRRVLLHGFVGTGKTAVAAAVAQAVLDRGPVAWVETGMEKHPTLIDQLVSELNQGELPGTADPAFSGSQLGELLTRKQVQLVVLDNVWMDGPALMKLVNAVPAHIPVLVTSRNRYPLKVIFNVGPLALDDALRLLREHTGQDTGGDPAARTLCAQLDGNPFALKIAGEMLRVDQMPPETLLKLIAETPHSIQVPQDFAEPGRRSLRDLLDASLYLLEEDERTVFRAFGLLADPEVTPELMALLVKHFAAEAAPPVSVLDTLNRLQRRALVDLSGDGYYRVSGMAHLYTKELVKLEQDRTGNRRAAVNACRDYVRDRVSDLDALDRERTNILKSLTAALADSQPGADGALLDIMLKLVIGENAYYMSWPHTELSLTLLEKAAEVAAHTGQHAQAHDLYQELGYILNSGFKWVEKAVTATQKSLDAARLMPPDRKDRAELAARIQLSTTYGDLSNQYFRQAEQVKAAGGSAEEAEKLEKQFADEALNGYAAAEAVARATHNDRALCSVLQHRGYFMMRRLQRIPEDQQDGQAFEQITPYFDQVIGLAQHLPDMHSVLFQATRSRAGCDFKIGVLKHDLTALERARQTHQDALRLAEAQDVKTDIAQCLEGLWEAHYGLARYWFTEAARAWVSQEAGPQQQALREFLVQANTTARQLKTLSPQAFDEYVNTTLAQGLDALTHALEDQQGGYRSAQELGDPAQISRAQEGLAKSFHALAEFRAAEALKSWQSHEAAYQVREFRDYLADYFHYAAVLDTAFSSTTD